MSPVLTLKIIITGRVQGVGYRWFARERAQEFELTGYVKNLASGDVEVVAQGREEHVWKLTNILRQGPSFSKVIDLNITVLSDEPVYNHFEVSF